MKIYPKKRLKVWLLSILTLGVYLITLWRKQPCAHCGYRLSTVETDSELLMSSSDEFKYVTTAVTRQYKGHWGSLIEPLASHTFETPVERTHQINLDLYRVDYCCRQCGYEHSEKIVV